MKNYDLYSNVEIDGYEVLFGIMHGDGKWTHWSDTGWEFDMIKDCVIDFIEALDDNGDKVIPPMAVVIEAEELAYVSYWNNNNRQW